MDDRISAGELRNLLCPIPDTIPDCATSLRSGVSITFNDVTMEGDKLVADFLYTFSAPFEWLEVPIAIKHNEN